MSIVKDLFFISLIFIMLIKYLQLYQNLIKERTYFINVLSHDLRVSSIAQIRGIELLLKKNTENEILKELYSSSKFSLEMINMLLSTYQYENKEYFLNYDTINVNELVSSTCNTLQDIAKGKSLSFCTNTNFNTNIYADRNEFSKVLTTLINTAIYNSESNKNIYIKTTQNSKETEFSITYQGKSLTEEECKRMFLQNPRFSTVGHGIKMHLVKKIIDFHNGKIFVKNIKENINSFTIIIPNVKRKAESKTSILPDLQLYKLS